MSIYTHSLDRLILQRASAAVAHSQQRDGVEMLLKMTRSSPNE